MNKNDLVGIKERDYCPFIREKTEQLLIELLSIYSPKKILEIGTFLGYSAGVMAETCPQAEIITVEKDQKNFQDACVNLKNFKNVLIKNCDALDFLIQTREQFDFIFLDGPKGQYFKYLPYLKKILKPGGILFADDVLFYGLVRSEKKIDHKHRSIVEHLRIFLEMLIGDSDFEVDIYDFEDGVAVAKKRGILAAGTAAGENL